MDGVRPTSLYQTRKTGPRFQRRLEGASGRPGARRASAGQQPSWHGTRHRRRCGSV